MPDKNNDGFDLFSYLFRNSDPDGSYIVIGWDMCACDEPEEPEFNINDRIAELNGLIDKSLTTGDKESFMKHSHERNMLMLEL